MLNVVLLFLHGVLKVLVGFTILAKLFKWPYKKKIVLLFHTVDVSIVLKIIVIEDDLNN